MRFLIAFGLCSILLNCADTEFNGSGQKFSQAFEDTNRDESAKANNKVNIKDSENIVDPVEGSESNPDEKEKVNPTIEIVDSTEDTINKDNDLVEDDIDLEVDEDKVGVEEEEKVDAYDCAGQYIDRNLPWTFVQLSGRKIIKKFDYRDYKKHPAITDIKIASDKNLKKMDLDLINPNGIYCLSLTALKKIKKVSINIHCDAELALFSVEAGKKIKKLVVNKCAEGAKYLNYDLAGLETLETSVAENSLEDTKMEDYCADDFDGLNDYERREFKITGTGKILDLNYTDKETGKSIVKINLKAEKKIKRMKINLLNPEAIYCVEMEAKKFKKVAINVNCEANLRLLNMKGKKIKKLSYDNCKK